MFHVGTRGGLLLMRYVRSSVVSARDQMRVRLSRPGLIRLSVTRAPCRASPSSVLLFPEAVVVLPLETARGCVAC